MKAEAGGRYHTWHTATSLEEKVEVHVDPADEKSDSDVRQTQWSRDTCQQRVVSFTHQNFPTMSKGHDSDSSDSDSDTGGVPEGVTPFTNFLQSFLDTLSKYDNGPYEDGYPRIHKMCRDIFIKGTGKTIRVARLRLYDEGGRWPSTSAYPIRGSVWVDIPGEDAPRFDFVQTDETPHGDIFALIEAAIDKASGIAARERGADELKKLQQAMEATQAWIGEKGVASKRRREE